MSSRCLWRCNLCVMRSVFYWASNPQENWFTDSNEVLLPAANHQAQCTNISFLLLLFYIHNSSANAVRTQLVGLLSSPLKTFLDPYLMAITCSIHADSKSKDKQFLLIKALRNWPQKRAKLLYRLEMMYPLPYKKKKMFFFYNCKRLWWSGMVKDFHSADSIHSILISISH